MTARGPGEWDAYFQRDERGERTEVLANGLGITDDDELQLAERGHGARAALRIRTGASPVAQTFDLAHPFREGNGRTTRLFLADVAALARRRLEFARIGKAVWDQRSELTSPDLGTTTPVPDAMVPVMHHVAGCTEHGG